ncbi:MAG: hypothetical protein M3R45_11200 [Pseudomonadota bacterium]|nr:hypothetical protein [Pseudomonadota bacterium]
MKTKAKNSKHKFMALRPPDILTFQKNASPGRGANKGMAGLKEGVAVNGLLAQGFKVLLRLNIASGGLMQRIQPFVRRPAGACLSLQLMEEKGHEKLYRRGRKR